MFDENYSWDKTAEQWMKVIDECKYADWKQPLRIIPPPEINMKEPSNYNFLQQLLHGYTYYEPHKNSHFARSMLTDLNRGVSKSCWDGFYTSEFSPFSSNKPRPINRETILNIFKNRLNIYNSFEDGRVNRSKLTGDCEKWLS